MRRTHDIARGRVERLHIESKALQGNLLGDPSVRELHIYLPSGHADGNGLPLLVDLVGFTGSGMSHTNWRNFGENVPERLAELVAVGVVGPGADGLYYCMRYRMLIQSCAIHSVCVYSE